MHDEGGVITVITPMPTVILTEFSYAADVARLAQRFQAKLQRVLQGLAMKAGAVLGATIRVRMGRGAAPAEAD